VCDAADDAPAHAFIVQEMLAETFLECVHAKALERRDGWRKSPTCLREKRPCGKNIPPASAASFPESETLRP
jgi:hypothetical protein